MKTDILAKIEEEIFDSIDRYKSILTFPRTNKTLTKNIEDIIVLVNNNKEISRSNLNQKFIENYNTSINTVRTIRPTLEKANLLMTVDEKVKITKMASEYLVSKDVGYLSKGFIYNYYGFLEILYLVHKKKPQKRSDILEEWVELFEEEFGKRSLNTNKLQFYKIFKMLEGFNYIILSEKKMDLNIDAFLHLENIEI
ncbi:hypothetical protein QA612_20170 [Evansella sp. AB-P1]|uniref:hypothetical protein n=1 Tax=Evansella sp. AB-P1 TaxID=3037653 RepID=UPI00241FE001|nr:hypothetical protein [Evansella sp. AB-P1]MDG5789779.1 hypothetical protein [Evansella sp. AB-P1]